MSLILHRLKCLILVDEKCSNWIEILSLETFYIFKHLTKMWKYSQCDLQTYFQKKSSVARFKIV